MKRAILLGLFFTASISIFGQSIEEEAIRQYLTELDATLVKDQPGAWKKFAAEDAVVITSNGIKRTQAEQIETIKKGTISFTALKRTIESLRLIGDAAVVVSYFRFTSKNTASGETVNGSIRNMMVSEKRRGQWTTVSVQSTRDEPKPDERELNRFVDSYMATLIGNSADETAKFLTSDFVHVESAGSMETRETLLRSMRSGDLKYRSLESSERKWRFMAFGGVAILTSLLQLKSSLNGRELSGAYRQTVILRRFGDDRWLIASTHISPLTETNVPRPE